jgi:tetratricopeptide (TPR) repeat protein
MKSMESVIVRMSRLLIAIVFAVICVVQVTGAEGWTRLDAPNFEVTGDADPAELARVASRLEKFRSVFVERFPKHRFSSPVPTRVVVFRDSRTFSRYINIEWAAGYYLAADDANFIVLSAEGGTKLSTVFHEYTHHLVESTLGRANVPPWLNEGLAEYHETFALTGVNSAMLGGQIEAHLELLRKSVWIPFNEFTSTDYYSLHKQTRASAIQFYAQSWVLVHYLIHGGKTTRKKEFDRFVEMVTSGSGFENAVRGSFGIDPATLETELKSYIRRKKFSSETIPLAATSAAEDSYRTSPVSDADAVATRAEILMRSGRLAEAETHIGDALRYDRDSDYVNTVAGLLQIRRKNWSEARRFLATATRSASAGYFAHYCFGLAVIRENMTDFGFAVSIAYSDAELARRALGRAVELNPRFAESYNLLAFVNFVRNERVDEGVVHIKKALAIAPGNQWYAVRLAELLMRKEEFGEARLIAQRVRQTASDDGLRIYAENTVRNIDSLESQTREIAELDKRSRDEITDAPLSEEELARRGKAALLESLNQALRPLRRDEKRILGRLVMIDCGKNGISFEVENKNGKSVFRAVSLDVVRLMSYDPRFVDAEFGCGVVGAENLAVFTFRPPPKIRQTSGELVSIEFVPADFRLLGDK